MNSSLRFLLIIYSLTAILISLVNGKQLTKESFRDVMQGSNGPDKNLFINFHSPRCPLCINLKPVWESLENMVRNQESAHSQLMIASVDCSKENDLCNQEGIKGFPTLKIFQAGDSIGTEYEGPRDISSLIELIYKQLGIQIKKEDHVQLKTVQKQQSSSEDVSFGEDTEEENKMAQERDRILNRETLKREDVDQPMKGLFELTDENYQDFLSKGRHFVKFFAPWCGYCKRLEPTWVSLADSFKHERSVSISRINCEDYRGVCDGFGVKGYPSLLWIVDGKVIEKYSGERTHAAFKSFVNGKVEAEKEASGDVRSEDIVAHLTDTNFKRSTSDGISFVTFSAPWCTHCKKVEPVIDDLAVKMVSQAKTERVLIAKVDCSQFDALCTQEGVDGYPTLILYRHGVNVREYEGEKTLTDMYDFVSGYLSNKDTLLTDKDEL